MVNEAETILDIRTLGNCHALLGKSMIDPSGLVQTAFFSHVTEGLCEDRAAGVREGPVREGY